MRFLRLRGAVVLAAAVLVGAGCEDPFAPLIPSPATKTDSFSGSFAQGGSVVHSFPVSAYGPITITMTSIGPHSTMGLGVSLAYWDGASCGLALIDNPNAKAGSEALKGTAQSANYCVRVYDSGNVPPDWTVSYSVDVLHP